MVVRAEFVGIAVRRFVRDHSIALFSLSDCNLVFPTSDVPALCVTVRNMSRIAIVWPKHLEDAEPPGDSLHVGIPTAKGTEKVEQKLTDAINNTWGTSEGKKCIGTSVAWNYRDADAAEPPGDNFLQAPTPVRLECL